MLFIYLYPVAVLIIKKKKFLLNDYQLDHQKLTNNQASLVGGYFLIIPIVFFFYKSYLLFSAICVLIFILGIFSDLNILSSPKKRFLLQLLLIFAFVIVKKVEVFPTRINFLDENFSNTYWSYFFTIFCLMILLNGSNFIDGLNGLFLIFLLIVLVLIY